MPIRQYVLDLEAYVPGEQPSGGDVIKLNTNENPYPPAPAVMAALSALTGDAFRKYPPATSDPLRDAIARRFGLTRDDVIIGYGSDEILRLLCHAILAPGDALASLEPSYSLYPVLGSLYQAVTRFVPEELPDNGAHARLPEAFVQSSCPLIFLPNPNPPYGTFYSLDEIRRLCAVNPDRIVVADEAYVDFAPASAVTLLPEFENLVVTRTFSKSYSLAGMRVGFGLARPPIIHALLALKDSYNLPIASQVAALAAWEAQDHFAQTCEQILATRTRLVAGLQERGFTVPETHGNFAFARHPRAHELFERLKARRIFARYWNKPPLNDGMRITVGTDREIDRLLEEIDRLLT